jgi:hypothetical protein
VERRAWETLDAILLGVYMHNIENIEGLFYTGKYSNVLFETKHFMNVVFKKSVFTNCAFSNCIFENCNIGHETKFLNTIFSNCKFYGKYSSLGNPIGKSAFYYKSNFINVDITGMNILDGCIFEKCIISGKLKNTILRDIKKENNNWGVQFNKCNLSDLIFNCVSVYGKHIFVKTILPQNNLIIINNKNNSFINICMKQLSILPENKILNISTLLEIESKKYLDTLIIDIFLLDSILTDPFEKELFIRFATENIIEQNCV